MFIVESDCFTIVCFLVLFQAFGFILDFVQAKVLMAAKAKGRSSHPIKFLCFSSVLLLVGRKYDVNVL